MAKDDLILNEKDRAKLDGIVSKMVANKESDADIQFVVNDFKSKYGLKKKEPTQSDLAAGESLSPSTEVKPPKVEAADETLVKPVSILDRYKVGEGLDRDRKIAEQDVLSRKPIPAKVEKTTIVSKDPIFGLPVYKEKTTKVITDDRERPQLSPKVESAIKAQPITKSSKTKYLWGEVQKDIDASNSITTNAHFNKLSDAFANNYLDEAQLQEYNFVKNLRNADEQVNSLQIELQKNPNNPVIQLSLSKAIAAKTQQETQYIKFKEDKYKQIDAEIKDLEEKVNLNPVTSSFWDVFRRDDFINKIKELKAQKENFFLDENALIQKKYSENKSALSEFEIPGNTPKEKLQNYYLTLSKERSLIIDKLKQSYGEDVLTNIGGTIQAQLASYLGIDNNADKLLAIDEKMKSLAPAVLINRNPVKDVNQGFFESTLKNATQTLIPSTQYVISNPSELASYVKESLALASLPEDVLSKATGKIVSEKAKGPESYNKEWWGNIVGTSVGMIPYFAVGTGLVKSASVAMDFTKIANYLAGAKYGKYLVAEPVMTGLGYKAAGYLMPSNSLVKDEATFLSGFFGGLGVAGVNKLMNTNYIAKMFNKLFGDKAESMAIMVAESGKRISSGVGETFEETGNNIGPMIDAWIATGDFQKLKSDFNENFGSMDKNLELFVASFTMGAIMGHGNVYGKTVDARSKDYYNNLSAEDKKKADSFVERLTQERYNAMVAAKKDEIKKSGAKAEPVTPKDLTDRQDAIDVLTNQESTPEEKKAALSVLADVDIKIENDKITKAAEAELKAGNTSTEVKPEDTVLETKAEPIVTQSVYDEFVNTGNVPESTLKEIAAKVKTRETLTEEENAIFAGKTSEINNIISKEFAEAEPKPLTNGTQIQLEPQIKGGMPRVMEFKDGTWFQKVGNELSTVSKEVQQEAQNLYDSQNKTRVSGEVGVGQEPIKTEPIKGAGQEAPSTGRDVQASEKVKESGEFVVQGTFNGHQVIAGNKAYEVADYRQIGQRGSTELVENTKGDKKIYTLVTPNTDAFNRRGYMGVSLVLPSTTTKTKAEIQSILEAKTAEVKANLSKERPGSFNKAVDMKYEGVTEVPVTQKAEVKPPSIPTTPKVEVKPPSIPVTQKEETTVQTPQEVDETKAGTIEQKTMELANKNVSKFLEDSGIEVNIMNTQEEFDAAQKNEGLASERGTEGVFISKSGKIYINKSNLGKGWAKTILYHEATHPVINIIRNTNLEKYNSMVSGVKELAKTNKDVNDALEWAKKQYAGKPEGTIEDEGIVEVIARISSGAIKFGQIEPTLREKIIEFINQIAKAIGLPPITPKTDTETFKKTARQVADAMRRGKSISKVVGKENVKEYEFGPEAQKRANEVFDGILEKIGIQVGSVNEKTGTIKVTNFDIAKAMNEYYKKAFKTIRIDDFGKKALDIVSEHATDEVIFAIEKFGNNSGRGWYTTDYTKALQIMESFDPDILKNPDVKEIATVAIAISSNSTDVYTNLTRVVYAINKYKETGKIPTDIGTGKGMSAIASSVNVYNNLLDLFGSVDDLKKFMQTVRTVSESKKALIEKAGAKSWAQVKAMGLGTDSEWNEDEVLPTSVILFGPKIGAFYSNLSGLGGAPTIDRWCIRTMYRYRGDMKAKALPSEIEDFITVNKLQGQSKGSVMATIQDHSKMFDAILTGRGEFKNQTKEERNQKLKPYRKGSQIWGKMSGIVNEIEDGLTEKIENKAEYARNFRSFTKKTFETVKEKVKAKTGTDLSISDIQAILWIYEKELFGALGVKQRPEATYSASAQRLLNELNAGKFTLDQMKAGKVTGSPDVTEEGAMGDSYGMTSKSFKDGIDNQPKRLNGTSAQKSVGQREDLQKSEKQTTFAQDETRRTKEATPSEVSFAKRIGRPVGYDALQVGQRGVEERGFTKTDLNKSLRIGGRDVKVKTEFVVQPSVREGIKANIPNAYIDKALLEITGDPDSYHKFISTVKANHPQGAAVYVYPKQDYANMRLFITPDGEAGVAIKPNGDFVSAFNKHIKGEGRKPNRLAQLMILGVKAGAKKADAFDTVLPDYYSKFGFRVVAKVPFSWDAAPEAFEDEYGNTHKGWEKEDFIDFNQGEPDVTFLVYDGGDRATIQDRVGDFDKYSLYENSLPYSTYDEAVEIQNKALKGEAQKSVGGRKAIAEVSKDVLPSLVIDPNERMNWKGYQVGDIISGDNLDELSGHLVGNQTGEKFVLTQQPLSNFPDNREELMRLEKGYEEEESDRLFIMKSNFTDTPPLPDEGDGMHRIISAKELGHKTILQWKNINSPELRSLNIESKSIPLPSQMSTGGREVMNVSGVQQRVKDLPEGLNIIDGFYSPIEKRILEFKQPKASATKWKEIVGAKSDEAVFSGMTEWLNTFKPDQQISKEEVQDFIKNNRVEIKQVIKADNWREFYDQRVAAMNKEYEYFKTKGIGRFDIQRTIPDSVIDKLSDSDVDRLIDLKAEQDFLSDVYFDYSSARQILTGAKESEIPKYKKYVERGDFDDYKEILVTAPTKAELERNGLVVVSATGPQAAEYRSSHYNERNIIVHTRTDVRNDQNGDKLFFIEEVQSDWGQQGKKEGFREPVTKADQDRLAKLKEERRAIIDKWGSVWDVQNNKGAEEDSARLDKVSDEIYEMTHKKQSTVPSGPYVANTNAWVKLGLKIALQQAVQADAVKLAWTTGEQQNKRYDLSKQVDAITYEKNSDDTYNVDGLKDNRSISYQENMTVKQMESVLGKDITQRIINNEGDTYLDGKYMGGVKVLTGDQLSVGGKGMLGFYGNLETPGIMGNAIKALVKELTGKEPTIEASALGYTDDYEDEIISNKEEYDAAIKRAGVFLYKGEVLSKSEAFDYLERGMKIGATFPKVDLQPSIEITPELKAAVEKGMAQFSKGERGVSANKPVILRHGGEMKITKFDSSKIKGGFRAELGSGYYFSGDEKYKDYGKEVTSIDASSLNLIDEYSKFPDGLIEKLVKWNESLPESSSGIGKKDIAKDYIDSIKKTVAENPSISFNDVRRNVNSKYRYDRDALWSEMMAAVGIDGMKATYWGGIGEPGIRQAVIYPQPKLDSLIIDETKPAQSFEKVESTFSKATDLFYKIKSTEGAAKRKALADERKALMDQNPSVKYIDDNIKSILDQLEKKEMATRKGNCP